MGTRHAFVLALAVASTLSFTGCKEDFVSRSTVDASATEDAGPPTCGESTTAYLDECAGAAECGSCVCEQAGHADVCTKACTVNEDCPAPSRGCSGGFCRP